MQRRTNLLDSSFIIILSIATILIQFVIYYFFAAFYVIWGISSLITIISCHILLEQTAAYSTCFNYSALILFISSIILFLSFMGGSSFFLPYSNTMIGIAVINWLLPCLYCYLRNMLDYGTRFTDYRIFYRNDALLFFFLYLVILLYGNFATKAFPEVYRGTLDAANFLPFETITVLIEDYLYGVLPLSDILFYVFVRILVFLPYGFQMTFLLKRQSRLPRFLVLLILPCALEAAQYFIIPERFDVDDVIYAVIGGILGSILYYLCNFIFRSITGKDFLSRESDYPYSRPGLHF
ncbi:glycopeptide antibiotics resistance protein [Anaerotaenia torta]|uniref:VanZ family protein n=1 Tax=Anaerotaenia torta TaxID=433293 RepID=UPI003D24C05C